MQLRRKYYDFFSKFYDKFIQFHSRDKNEKLREFLAQKTGINNHTKVLDLCCGTGSNFIHFKKYAPLGFFVGIDFSFGMLLEAKKKFSEAILILGDVEFLPFKDNTFDVLTYTYAFYELKGEKVHNTLVEINRVLKPNGKLFIMEHEIPENNFIKILYYIRLATMGLKKARTILSHEEDLLKQYFSDVKKITTLSRRSKIIICQKRC